MPEHQPSENPHSAHAYPITTPEIGAGQLPVHVSSWLVEVGEYVFEGDRIVELMCPGVTFDIQSPRDGILIKIEKHSGSLVTTGDSLGVLQSPEQEL